MAEQLEKSRESILKEIFNEINRIERKKPWFSNFNILLKALSIRDSYTEGHSRRVALYSYLIAKEMGFDEDTLSRLYVGAFLHDIGKIGIPDAILLKPTRLTPIERKLVEKHPILGYELLKDFKFPLVLSIVLKHHERIDGKGYPLGVDQREIPITVNIVGLADVFDALTSERPYRKALPLEEVIHILESDSGKAFYPEVVEVGVKVLRRIGVLDIFRGSLLTEDLEKFRKEAFFTDVVTGLPVFSRWKDAVEALGRKENIVFVAFDIKGLLLINLTRSWEKGDEILSDIGSELRSRRLGYFCRFTGGTFLGVIRRERLSELRELISEISAKHNITIHDVAVEKKNFKSPEELIALLIRKLREKKEFTFSSGGMRKLLRRRWR